MKRKKRGTGRIAIKIKDKMKFAEEMKANPTPAEKHLWQHICDKQVNGIVFDTQVVIRGFIVDFYCKKAKLIIEVDGAIHDKRKEYDENRTKVFNNEGYRVIRFTNVQVLNDVESVIKEIAKCVALGKVAKESIIKQSTNRPIRIVKQAETPKKQKWNEILQESVTKKKCQVKQEQQEQLRKQQQTGINLTIKEAECILSVLQGYKGDTERMIELLVNKLHKVRYTGKRIH